MGLQEALSASLGWLASEPAAGVHPLKLVAGTDANAPGLLSRRSRLLLRVPRDRLAQTLQLCGAELALGDYRIRVGPGHARELLAHSTLYAYHVFSPDGDEVGFMQSANDELDHMGVRYLSVCGKNHRYHLGGRDLSAFSLMLHGLNPQDSLRIQERGVGPHRQWGCGLFVPHKSAAAVGA